MIQAIFGYFSRTKPIPIEGTTTMETNDSLWSWVSEKLRWSPTSLAALKDAEQKILSYVKSPINLSFVNINLGDKECQIRTLSMNCKPDDESEKRVPLVLLHGLGAGIGLWVLNLDSLSRNQPLYAMDVLGFGMSSRPVFRGSAEEVENQLVESIEKWREKMNLKKFVLLGHSMGGFLATSYALKHPDRICHLILADPWGFPERDETAALRIHIPLWAKVLGSIMKHFNPLTSLRIAGPWGPRILKKVRPDILQKFTIVVDDPEIVSNYIYHCNAQTPSGETAFKSMSEGFGWAKLPMLSRIGNLREDVPVTFIYGSRSWVDSQSGYTVQKMREKSKVDVFSVPRAGHHVYADQPALFHSIVHDVCNKVNDGLPKESYCTEDEEFLYQAT